MVIKRDKSETPLLSSVAVSHDINDLDFAKLLEVIPKVRLLCVFFDASHKDFLDRYMSTWTV